MATVQADECYSFEDMLKRFRKRVEAAGILGEIRARAYYEKPSDKARRRANLRAHRAKMKGGRR